VTASPDGTARLWDAATGAPLLLLKGMGEEPLSAFFTRDGQRIITTGVDQIVRSWEAVGSQGE
jgi:WD40 repeat protein